jgi:hypothetical protein
MEMQEEAVKMIYDQDNQPVGLIKQNGVLKFYKLVEVTYKDIDELFNQKSV